MRRPICMLDFDNTIYPGRFTAADKADLSLHTCGSNFWIWTDDMIAEGFDIHIFSSRSHQPGGIDAMRHWLHHRELIECGEPRDDIPDAPPSRVSRFYFPLVKPPAMISIDDRAITFTGTWPSVASLKAFRPWNKPSTSP